MSESRPTRGSVHVLHASEDGAQRCDVCTTAFVPSQVFQRVALRDAVRWVCSPRCRDDLFSSLTLGSSGAEPLKIAVLNQKGGTGKTTTSVNLGWGLAQRGYKVLIVDVDAQGHVGISLGVKGKRSLYHVVVEGQDPTECVVPVTDNLHVLSSNETLASAEIYLARMNDGRDRVLRRRMEGLRNYDFVLLDCGPSLSLLNMNALTYADELLVPVSCDFLSLVGVRQILKTVKRVNKLLMHPIRIMGVLPTFYDPRNRISNESIESLRAHFKDRVLPPIRVNTLLREAPSHKQSIFEYRPDSRGARDYGRLVKWVEKEAESRRVPHHA